jgi:hypothetical protein
MPDLDQLIAAKIEAVRATIYELKIKEQVLLDLLKEIQVEEEKPGLAHPISGRALLPWTDDDDRILREHYPEGGTAAVKKLLPHRTNSAIRQRCKVLKINITTQARKRLARESVCGTKAPAAPPPPPSEAAAPAAPERPVKSKFEQDLERVAAGEVGIAPVVRVPGRAVAENVGGSSALNFN